MSPAQAVIYLTGCAVNGETPDREQIETMDLDEVYQFASQHLLSVCVSIALESAGYRDKRSSLMLAESLHRYLQFESALQQVRARLEAAGIWYMPLKGSLLKDDYPQPYMREMADRDILYDAARTDDVRSIMEELGFTAERFGIGNEDTYNKPPVLSFEMHSALFGEGHDPKLTAYYSHIEDRLLPGRGLERRFTPEDFYLYLIAHEYKHYTNGGTGLRTFLDLYVYLRKYGDTLDMAYIQTEAEKLGVADFEQASRSLALHLFGEGELEEQDMNLLRYTVDSGAFGSLRHTLEITVPRDVAKYGGGFQGKARYAWHRIFLPRQWIYNRYPFFDQHRYLLPVYPFYRVYAILFHRRNNLKQEIDVFRKTKG